LRSLIRSLSRLSIPASSINPGKSRLSTGRVLRLEVHTYNVGVTLPRYWNGSVPQKVTLSVSFWLNLGGFFGVNVLDLTDRPPVGPQPIYRLLITLRQPFSIVRENQALLSSMIVFSNSRACDPGCSTSTG